MALSVRSSTAVALGLAAFTISGCGGGGSTTQAPTPSPPPTPDGPSPTPSPSPPSPSPPAPAPPPSPSGPAAETSIWAWRQDMDHGTEVCYDLSGDYTDHGMNGGCARMDFAYTAGECRPDDPSVAWEHVSPCVVEGKTFVEYLGETGVKTYNQNHDQSEWPGKRGCVWRKTRVPIDLSKIETIELDLETTPAGCCNHKAPWYSVWLVPMNYSDIEDNAKAAEIDLIENYDYNGAGDDVSLVKSNFAQCGDQDYTMEHCKNVQWSVDATSINHHISVKTTHDPVDGRVITIYHCPNPEGGDKLDTCPEDSPNSWIKVEKTPPEGVEREKWFPVWNQDLVGANYAHYWLQTDQWWTSGTDFALALENLKFFEADGTEWKMPLDYGPDNDLGVYSQNHPPASSDLEILI